MQSSHVTDGGVGPIIALMNNGSAGGCNPGGGGGGEGHHNELLMCFRLAASLPSTAQTECRAQCRTQLRCGRSVCSGQTCSSVVKDSGS